MRTIVYGNGRSRLKWDLKQNLHNDVITWGCNRIYNDTVVDNLVAVDYWVQHDIVESGYPKNNKCWFTDWEVLPIEYDVEYLKEQYLAQGCSTFIENDNTNKTKKVIRDRLPTESWKHDLPSEIGDVLWYCAVLADYLDYDLGKIMENNLDKLKSRKKRGVLGGSGDNR